MSKKSKKNFFSIISAGSSRLFRTTSRIIPHKRTVSDKKMVLDER